MKQKIFSIIRILVSVGIIAFFLIFQKETLATFIETLKDSNYFFILLAIVGYIPVMTLSIIRWNALLKVQGVNLPVITLIRLFLIGTFFNNFTLGVTGGDVIKAYYVSHEAKGKRAEAVITVFLDRIIGMLALFSIALIALFFTENNDFMLKIRNIILALFIGALTFCFLLFNKSFLKKIPFGEQLIRKLPFYHGLIKIYNAFHLYHHHKGTILFTYLLSIVLQVTMMLVIYMLGFALDIQNTQLVHYFLFFPIIATLSALPISLGGLGVGEAAFVYFFGLVGVPSGKAFALGLCTRFVWITWGLIGGLIYMLPSNTIKKKEALEEAEKLEALEESEVK